MNADSSQFVALLEFVEPPMRKLMFSSDTPIDPAKV
uniref:Uncharacterized protein n=1 Tax=Peronospora matthiolae TaxID=2874970 RepID=A0AAV1TDX2_9STRA